MQHKKAMFCIGVLFSLVFINHGLSWWNTTFDNYRNITITNSTPTPSNYSIVVVPNVNLGNICGIRVLDDSETEIPFGFKDNGNLTLDSDEEIIIGYEDSFPRNDYQVYYNNNTPVLCKNITWEQAKYTLLFEDFSSNKSYWVEVDSDGETIIDYTTSERIEYSTYDRWDNDWIYANLTALLGQGMTSGFEAIVKLNESSAGAGGFANFGLTSEPNYIIRL